MASIALQAQPVRLAVGRHVLVAVAVDAAAVQALVDAVEDGDPVRLVAVVLRQHAVAAPPASAAPPRR